MATKLLQHANLINNDNDKKVIIKPILIIIVVVTKDNKNFLHVL